MINGLIPSPPIASNTGTIPPLAIELAVAKPHNLSQSVEYRLKDGEEAGEPDDQRNGGEFHQSFGDRCDIQYGELVQGVVQ